MSTGKRSQIMTREKVQFSLMMFVLRKSQLFKERKRERLSQNGDLFSPVLCIPWPVLWVPQVASHPEAREGWWLLILGVLTRWRSQRGRIPTALPSFLALMGLGSRAGEGSLFCHFPCCTLSAVKKRLQTPELSVWHFSLALKNNFKIY